MADDIRKPVVANIFYPEDKINLKRMIMTYLSDVPVEATDFVIKQNISHVFGIIVPHAGYIYSGQTAAYGYSLVNDRSFDTVVLIGPSHRTYFEGFSLCRFKSYDTPFGEIPVDRQLADLISQNGSGVFTFLDSAHVHEHSLEVQLPFLSLTLTNEFRILPIIMGEQSYESAVAGAEVLAKALKKYDRSVLFVISSDLSHYHSDADARRIDALFIDLLMKMEPKRLMTAIAENKIEACGAGPIATFLMLAKKLEHTNIKNLVYSTSADSSGDTSKVVGYLSAAIW